MNAFSRNIWVSLVTGVLILNLPVAAQNRSDVETVVKGNSAFALDLYARLKEADGNLFFSPYSISTALVMTYAGARGNTEKQTAHVLHFALSQKRLHPAFAAIESELNAAQEAGYFELEVANALWAQQGHAFLEDFLTVIKESYGAEISFLDFKGACEAARRRINTWVEQKTKDRIKDLVKPGILDQLVRLVMTNAICFKGMWANGFEKELTRNLPFKVTASTSVEAPMMCQENEFRYTKNDNLQILELPYGAADLSMVVLLPRKVGGLPQLEAALNMKNLDAWLSHLEEREVRVILPKFKTSSEFSLSETLSSMGMSEAFDDSADFSGMDGTEWLCISAVIHKAFVAVDEEGTEATAATAVAMSLKNAYPSSRPAVFRADRPFVFLIRDNRSGSILFLGRLVNPKG